MGINNLRIENFRSIESLNLKLPSSNRVLCFIGENGSSKTSVLSLIAEGLVSRTKLKFPNFSTADSIRYRIASMLEIKQGAEFYSCQLSYSSNDSRFFQYKKLLANRNDLAPEKYSSVMSEVQIPRQGFPLFESSTLDGLYGQEDFLNTNVFLIRPGGRYENYDYESKNIVAEKTSVKVAAGFENDMPYPFYVAHSGSDAQETILNMLFDSYLGYPHAKISARVITPILQEITGKNFGHLQVSSMPYRQLLSSEIGQVKTFSQGELDLLVTVVNIIKQQLYIYDRYTEVELKKNGLSNPFEVPGIVIIDEVDLHLHPKAQESYIGILTTRFPNIQFILTSHSPFIIRGLPKDSVVVHLPDGRVFSNDFKKMGIDSIVETIFQYSGRFSSEVVTKLNEFRNQLVSISPDMEILKKIFAEFSESDSARGELELYLASYGDDEIKTAILEV